MELLQLRYFCDAARTQNFSRTARRYQVPASNISQSIKRLEEELEATLFDRRGNRVHLNSRGEAFCRLAGQALEMLERAKQEAKSTAETQELRLGVRLSRRIVMQAVSEFQARFPQVNIVAEHGDYTQNNDFDVIVTDAAFQHGDFVRVRAFREDILLAYRKGLLPEGAVRSEDLADKAFITMSANYSMHNITRDICRDLGFEPRIALQSEDPEYIRRCVELGLGVCLMPVLSWRGLFSDGVEFRSLGEQSRDICIYSRRTPCASKYVEIFNHMLVEVFEREAAQT